jgi:hypothetical protein
VIAYKFLRADGTSVFTGFRWPLPDGGPGAWVEAAIDPCRSGIHACRTVDLPYWAGRRLFEVELAGEIREEPTKVVASRARLLRHVGAWEDAVRGDYLQMCAERSHRLARDIADGRADWTAVIEPGIASGPGMIGFVAARIAEVTGGPAAYRAERAHQVAWLAERLRLAPS